MSHHQLPNVGERFKISGVEFEISFIQSNLIRYSTVAGGQIKHFSVDQYFNLLDQKKLILSNKKAAQESILPSQLNGKQKKAMKRKLRYVRALYKHARYPTSKKEAEPILKRVAEDNNDLPAPSSVTVSRWFKTYISSSQDPMSLAPKTNGGNRACANTDTT